MRNVRLNGAVRFPDSKRVLESVVSIVQQMLLSGCMAAARQTVLVRGKQCCSQGCSALAVRLCLVHKGVNARASSVAI